jgi:beta-lactamase class D
MKVITLKTLSVSILLFVLVISAYVVPAFAAFNGGYKTINLASFFGEYKSSAFILYNCETGITYVYNYELAQKRISPCSTFKIPNSLIGLETKVISGENHVIKWDGTPGYFKSWNCDHTLASAIKNSVVWYYQALAKEVGFKRMKSFIDLIQYGNMDISGGISQFWLHGPGGSLKISAFEQVEFLKNLLFEKLPFTIENMKIVKKIIELDRNENYLLSGKTGSGKESGHHACGWFVGTAENKNARYVFASVIECGYKLEEKPPMGMEAKKITISILKSLKIIK